uniref:Uncharacterized protein n=1 Tax=Timema monikensis TaxID=170555 RepID=A0A7R9DZY4_9NEOP|nr:unnamed protein product [Timema monikensis]
MKSVNRKPKATERGNKGVTMDNEKNNFVSKETYCVEMLKIITYCTSWALEVAGQLYPWRFEVYRFGQLLVGFVEPGEGLRRLRFTGDLSEVGVSQLTEDDSSASKNDQCSDSSTPSNKPSTSSQVVKQANTSSTNSNVRPSVKKLPYENEETKEFSTLQLQKFELQRIHVQKEKKQSEKLNKNCTEKETQTDETMPDRQYTSHCSAVQTVAIADLPAVSLAGPHEVYNRPSAAHTVNQDITDGCHKSLQLFHFRNSICISNMGCKSLFIFKTDFRNLGKVVNTFTDCESGT